MSRYLHWTSYDVRKAAENSARNLRIVEVERTVGYGRVREIERLIGHAIPEPHSETLKKDCRMSAPEFAAELIRVSKLMYA